MALVEGPIKPGFLADDRGNGTMILVPPPNGGAIGWGPVYLSFGSDFGDVVLRVAIYNHISNAWRVTDQLKVPSQGGRVTVTIQDGDEKVSVGRVKNGSTDAGTWPCAFMLEATLKA